MINHNLINQKLIHSFIDFPPSSFPIPLIGVKRIWHQIQMGKFLHQTSEIVAILSILYLCPQIFSLPIKKLKSPTMIRELNRGFRDWRNWTQKSLWPIYGAYELTIEALWQFPIMCSVIIIPTRDIKWELQNRLTKFLNDQIHELMLRILFY